MESLLAFPGIYANKADQAGHTPIHLASEDGHADVLKLLLAVPGINVSPEDGNGLTPLHFACSGGQTEAMRLLLAAPGISRIAFATKQHPTDVCVR